MPEYLHFATRADFRSWLEKNHASSGGVWLLLGKAGGPRTVKAGEALEEALCFGWIDGQMRSLDEGSYVKYFAERRPSSKWSEKNKAIAQRLEAQGSMTEYGRAKIEQAKKNGQWNRPKAAPVTEAQIAALLAVLKDHEPAYTNFQAMPPSVRKTYARAYLDAKTEVGRAGRFAWIVDRLNKNLRPM